MSILDKYTSTHMIYKSSQGKKKLAMFCSPGDLVPFPTCLWFSLFFPLVFAHEK